jgi:hypothetical protein
MNLHLEVLLTRTYGLDALQEEEEAIEKKVQKVTSTHEVNVQNTIKF